MKASTDRQLSGFSGEVLDGRRAVLDALDGLAGRRVALVGDPVEVTRLVARVARGCASLTVFQDRGVWVLPRVAGLGPAIGSVSHLLPSGVRRRATAEVGRHHLRRGVRDGWTRRQLGPRDAPTARTVVYSDRYLRALGRSDVRLVTWPIAGFVADGLRTADGLEHHVDVIARV